MRSNPPSFFLWNNIKKNKPTHRDFTTIFYQHGEERRWEGGQEEEVPCLLRLVSPEILLWGQMRVSFLWAKPCSACRGRHHARVSPSVQHFSLEKGGRGVWVTLMFTLGNKLVAGSVFVLLRNVDIYSAHRVIL